MIQNIQTIFNFNKKKCVPKFRIFRNPHSTDSHTPPVTLLSHSTHQHHWTKIPPTNPTVWKSPINSIAPFNITLRSFIRRMQAIHVPYTHLLKSHHRRLFLMCISLTHQTKPNQTKRVKQHFISFRDKNTQKIISLVLFLSRRPIVFQLTGTLTRSTGTFKILVCYSISGNY
jgi:hypothetical protein